MADEIHIKIEVFTQMTMDKDQIVDHVEVTLGQDEVVNFQLPQKDDHIAEAERMLRANGWHQTGFRDQTGYHRVIQYEYKRNPQ